MPGTSCPHCGKVLDRASDPKNERDPIAGDLSVCIACAGVMQFAPDMSLVKCPTEVIAALPDKDRRELLRIRNSILDLIELRR